MRVTHEIGKFLKRQILRESPCGKIGKPAVNGIRARRKSGKRGFEITCRS
jgi:hypothetical protein